jgi:6-phosphogluconolactonase (cycloisomerase 2 family)
MKFHSIVRSGFAAVTSLALALGLASCSRDYTVAYVYSVSAANGTVSAYAVDYQDGVLTQLNGSPFATQFTNPTTLITAPSGKFLYVIGGTQQSEVEEFAIGTDGKLYGQHTYNIAGGTYPTAAAIDSTGTFLYVTFTYQTGFTPALPGPGGVSIFPINADNSLGTPTSQPLGNNPIGITLVAPTCVTPASSARNPSNRACGTGGAVNVFAYVVDQEASPNASIVEYYQNTSNGSLTKLPPSANCTGTPTVCGIHAGVTPSAITSEPTGRYVYVTDKTSNQIIGYSIDNTATYANNGILTPIVSSPYSTGLYPVSLTVDPRGKYLYTANYNSNTVSSYSINAADGSLGGTAAVGNFSTATGPTCVTVEPALGIYLFTSNYLDMSISGGQLSPNTGGLTTIANSPFPAGALPNCIASVANGEHASSLVNP